MIVINWFLAHPARSWLLSGDYLLVIILAKSSQELLSLDEVCVTLSLQNDPRTNLANSWSSCHFLLLPPVLFLCLALRLAFHYPSLSQRHPRLNGKQPALVTGASDGIGQAFAGELCRRGFNIVLHRRNPRKPEKVEKEINQNHPDSLTRIVIFDANLSHPSLLERDILAKVQDLRLSVQVNNIGGTAGVQSPSEIYSTINEYNVETMDGILNINVRFTSQITRLLLSLLLERPRSLIMNISSAAEQGMPYLSVYSGTKF